MPKIRIDRFDNGSYRCDDGHVRSGLRDRQTNYDGGQILRTQREKDDCFDMYRSTDTVRTSPVRKRASNRETSKLWYVAGIIAALGAFCLFVDSVFITVEGMTFRLASFEILLKASDVASAMPSCVVYMSAIPLVFLGLFLLFIVMKERSFEKASLIVVAISVFIIAMLIHWTKQIESYRAGYMTYLDPGYSLLVEIGCAGALIIVVACQWIMAYVSQNRTSLRRR